MPSTRFPEDQHLVSKRDLLEHASLSVLRHAVGRLPGQEDWLNAGLRKEPITIYDINGQPLFYDFPVRRGEQILGHVRMAASKVLGAPVIAHELGGRFWDFDAAAKRLLPVVKREFPRARIEEPKLVCYSYPKLGVQFQVTPVEGEPKRLIFDVANRAPIPEQPPRPGYEGAYAWSFYDALSDETRRSGLKRFNQHDVARLEVASAIREDLVAARVLRPFADRIVVKWGQTITRQLQFCTHYGYTHARGHHCFSLKGQETVDYCAVATCQMILCYYRYYYTQDQIAPALGYAPGGCPADQSAGYEQLTGNHVDATYDTAPTFDKARQEINALRPFKSGVPHHARACAGFSYWRWGFGGGALITDRKLYIYDPWPNDTTYDVGGAITWEDWDSQTYTNYVMVRLVTP